MTQARGRLWWLAAAVGLFWLSWVAVHLSLTGRLRLVDWPTYQAYGDAMRHGAVPYRDFAVEYPPGSLPVFVLPSILGGDYARTFEWVMAACGVALVAVTFTVRPRAAAYVALAPLLVGSLILSRFDLWPALLATAALAMLLAGRDGVGWGLLGAAVAAKLWPAVLVPLALRWSLQRGRRLAPLVGAAVLAAAVLPFLVLAPHGLWQSLSGQASRPLQVESLAAAFVITFGHPAIVSSHGSQNVVGHGALAAVFALVQAGSVVALWVAFWRGRATRERLLRYSAACVAAFVAFGKVLSPQFLLWLIPLVPLVYGRRGFAATGVLTAALLLTQVWFPQHYFDYALQGDRGAVVLARDVLLVVLVGVLAWPSRIATRAWIDQIE